MSKNNKSTLFRMLILRITITLISLSLIIIRSATVDAAISGDEFFLFISILIAVELFVRALGVCEQKFNSKFYINLKTNIDQEIFYKITRIPVCDFEKRDCKDTLDSALSSSDFYRLKYDSLLNSISESLNILILLAIISSISLKFSLMLLAIIIIFLQIQVINSRRIGDIWEKYRKNTRRANYFSNILINNEFNSDRKIFNNSRFFIDKFNDYYELGITENKSLGKKRMRMDLLYNFISSAIVFSFIFLFSRQVMYKELTFGLFVSLFYQILKLRDGVDIIINSVFDYKNAVEKEKNVIKFLEYIEITNGKKHISSIHTIEFRDVYFKYPNSNHYVINGLSIFMENKNYALVGENGSGKTTLIKLITGLYHPDRGEILINGINIKEIDSNDLIENISVVMQIAYHYPAKLIENLHFGNKYIYDEKCANDIGLYNIISNMPFGLNTDLSKISQFAVDLSGGEWQRISIARALFKNASLCILDEPNALLDPVSEVKLYDLYRKKINANISLFVSHRLGATKSMDEIIVLKGGKVNAVGNHEELMKTNYYRELYSTQKGLYL